MTASTTRTLRVCSIGAGRMGRALMAACERAGHDASGTWSRSSTQSMDEVLAGRDVVFVAVPDDAIADVLETLARRADPATSPLLVVTSGSIELAPHVARTARRMRIVRMHPLQVVAPDADADVFDGIIAAMTAFDEPDRTDAFALARSLGMRPVDLADADAPAWHAAAVFASNYVTTLVADAMRLATVATGIDEAAAAEAFSGLAAAALEQVRRTGPVRALTGPIARGDERTVERHRAALRADAHELLAAYDALAARTHELAGRARHPEVTA